MDWRIVNVITAHRVSCKFPQQLYIILLNGRIKSINGSMNIEWNVVEPICLQSINDRRRCWSTSHSQSHWPRLTDFSQLFKTKKIKSNNPLSSPPPYYNTTYNNYKKTFLFLLTDPIVSPCILNLEVLGIFTWTFFVSFLIIKEYPYQYSFLSLFKIFKIHYMVRNWKQVFYNNRTLNLKKSSEESHFFFHL